MCETIHLEVHFSPHDHGILVLLSQINGQVTIRNLEEVEVKAAEEVQAVLDVGMRNRATSSTKMNDRSSRSHLVTRLTLDLVRTTKDGKEEQRSSAVHLIDLAGSER